MFKSHSKETALPFILLVVWIDAIALDVCFWRDVDPISMLSFLLFMIRPAEEGMVSVYLVDGEAKYSWKERQKHRREKSVFCIYWSSSLFSYDNDPLP